MTDTTTPRHPYAALRDVRTSSVHGLAQVRVRSLGTRPVGPLRVTSSAPAPARPAVPHP
ncbi:hypothetical protein [Curtobacterium sp. MCSS17_007]|uniref:hypothetical protein n=1 Tax=Curtobacterium sp. MCSS17_007 TaxID=2175646 RepID=UPI0015E8A976|nr:hypothetical protein [Curtobacterium sp. MCSS17_007]WIE74863.1 hypothetical protein DEJ22_011435 [Curtobacterium sp. MCSS17_007]